MEYSKQSNEYLVKELYKRFKCMQRQKRETVVFFGITGSGKGTHSFKLSQRLCYCLLSTGTMLRKEVTQQTEFGQKVRNIIEHGDLVSDQIMIDLISQNLDK